MHMTAETEVQGPVIWERHVHCCIEPYSTQCRRYGYWGLVQAGGYHQLVPHTRLRLRVPVLDLISR
jgi:hypothetical protein